MKGALICLETIGTKPNFSELGRIYNCDRRTAKNRYLGIVKDHKPRNKPSKLDKHVELIKQKIKIPGSNMRAVYEFIITNVDDNIGTYSNFRKFVAKNAEIIKAKQEKVHPRFETEFGKQLQFDWKGPITLHTRKGDEFQFYVFSTTLCASRLHNFVIQKFMIREIVQRSLIEVFNRIGGVTEEILTDNMSSIVNYSQHEFVPEFKAFCKDMGINPKKCKVRHCQTKGKVESCNRFVNWLMPYDYEFDTYEELIVIMDKINNKINTEINEATNMPAVSLFETEKEHLKPLPKQDILDHYIESMIPAKVSVESLVYYKGTKYSVSPKYINKTVKISPIENKLLIYYNKDLIAEHELSNQKIKYNKNDYIECLKQTMPYYDDSKIEEMANENLELLNRITK